MNGEIVTNDTIAGRGANAIRAEKDVKKLFKNGFLSYQQERKMTPQGIVVGKDDRDAGDYAYIGYTDFIVDPCVVDIKSSDGARTAESVKNAKRQAKMYKFFTGKDIVFVVLNKNNMKVQVIDVRVEQVDDLHTKAYELYTMYREQMFRPNPGWYCKICSFQEICLKDRKR